MGGNLHKRRHPGTRLTFSGDRRRTGRLGHRASGRVVVGLIAVAVAVMGGLASVPVLPAGAAPATIGAADWP